MSGALAARRRRVPALSLLGLAVLAVPLFLLATVSGLGLVAGAGVAVVAFVGSLALFLAGPRVGRVVRVAPALLGLAVLAVTAGTSYATELIAGAGAIAALFGLGASPPVPSEGRRVASALTVPSLGFALMLVTSLLFSAAHRLVGVAAVILVVVVAAVALLVHAPDAGEPEEAPA